MGDWEQRFGLLWLTPRSAVNVSYAVRLYDFATSTYFDFAQYKSLTDQKQGTGNRERFSCGDEQFS
ncbi:hypothetical protein VB711_06130, partial [Cronbergia sp. UHCC 0137]|uniref:hypothetical protein n=1 Tax=Cronbergia sp. UHCC 0137 TaxID=3110239 RepID=UPI002B214171